MNRNRVSSLFESLENRLFMHSGPLQVTSVLADNRGEILITLNQPIRASKKSAQWCLDAVDVCWQKKEPNIRDWEKPAAKEAYDFARAAYREVLAEATED